MVVVSACLAGMACRYDGGADPDPEVVDLVCASRTVPGHGVAAAGLLRVGMDVEAGIPEGRKTP